MEKLICFSLWNRTSTFVYFSWCGFTVDGEADMYGGDTTHSRIDICTVSFHFTPRSWNPDYLHRIPAFEGQWGPSDGCLVFSAGWSCLDNQHGILHPRSSQTHNLGGCMAWCCSATLLPSAVTHSHGKTSPLMISAALTWIPPDLIFDLSFIYGEPWKT